MPFPNAESAFVPSEKLTAYLLNEHHAVGGHKARWFFRQGYDPAHPEVLEQDLLRLARSTDPNKVASPFGTKYIATGTMRTPAGNIVSITTVWIVEPAEPRPRLVTAFPED